MRQLAHGGDYTGNRPVLEAASMLRSDFLEYALFGIRQPVRS
jgi:hypothetical protein